MYQLLCPEFCKPISGLGFGTPYIRDLVGAKGKSFVKWAPGDSDMISYNQNAVLPVAPFTNMV